jgi:hypothetical protein
MNLAAAMSTVIDSENLKAFSALPLFVYIVDYNPPVKNIWANEKYLASQGNTLDHFCTLVFILSQSKLLDYGSTFQFVIPLLSSSLCGRQFYQRQLKSQCFR